MKLYHGSNGEIDKIDLSICRPYKDFGKGFYCTTIREQAAAMAKRVARIYGGDPMVTAFVFDEKELGGLQTRIFDKPNFEWATFIMNNRSRTFSDFSSAACNHDLKYDIVSGPIANDDLALLFRSFESGLITVDALVKEMQYKKLTDQYSFHTPRAVACLVKDGVYRV